MTTITVSIHPSEGITTQVNDGGKGTLVAERSPRFGVEGGMGYGGGEILAFAAGVCFFNNVRRLANETGLSLRGIEVDVTAETSGDPPITREITITPTIDGELNESQIHALLKQALGDSYVADMLAHNVDINLALSDATLRESAA
jgi:uncharacterized OsmC-like protein